MKNEVKTNENYSKNASLVINQNLNIIIKWFSD